MAKYKFKIEADGVDISSSVLSGFTITNGRNILTQGFVQWSASLSAFKKDLKEILVTAGKDPDFVSPGTEIKISVETAPSTWLTMFRGIIVSSSGSDYQFRFECIDEVFFGFSQAQPDDIGFNVNLDNYISSVSVAAETKFRFDGDITLTNQFPFYAPGSATRGDYASVINEASQTAKYTFLELYLPDDRSAVPIQPGQFFAGELENVDITTTDVSIDDGDIDISYSIQRNSSDIYNTIQVDYNGGSVTLVDNTSVAKMGTKLLVIDSHFTDPPPGGYTTPTKEIAARALAEALLQQHGVWGYALIKFSTSADRLGLSVENTVKKIFPKKVIDASSVTAEEFQDKLVIQEVQHTCSPDYWAIDIVAGNYRFVTKPQTWAEVSSSLTWANVPDYLTWDMIRTKDL